MTTCLETAQGRRKLFWATQPDACGTFSPCPGQVCGKPGLKFFDGSESQISDENWIRGLIINMLMTDGRRRESACGERPRGVGGHWSESFMEEPATVGTLMRAQQPTGTIQQQINLVVAAANETLQRLVSRGIAKRVEVTPEYLGSLRLGLNIEVFGATADNTRVNLVGEQFAGGWRWSPNV